VLLHVSLRIVDGTAGCGCLVNDEYMANGLLLFLPGVKLVTIPIDNKKTGSALLPA
jgi:hypothetical protein